MDDELDIDAPDPAAAAAPFVDLSDVARERIAELGGELGRVTTVFAQAVGTQLAQHVTPVSIKRGVLHVRCSSASWAQSLTFMQRELLDRLCELLPAVELRSLRVSVGAAPTSAASRQTTHAPSATAVQPPLDASTDAALHDAVRSIEDPALRASVLAAARASVQRQREQR